MEKIVLNVATNDLKRDDVLIYSEAKKCFINVKKATFLSNRIKRENELEQEINNLKLELECQKQKFQELVNIVKENVK